MPETSMPAMAVSSSHCGDALRQMLMQLKQGWCNCKHRPHQARCRWIPCTSPEQRGSQPRAVAERQQVLAINTLCSSERLQPQHVVHRPHPSAMMTGATLLASCAAAFTADRASSIVSRTLPTRRMVLLHTQEHTEQPQLQVCMRSTPATAPADDPAAQLGQRLRTVPTQSRCSTAGRRLSAPRKAARL